MLSIKPFQYLKNLNLFIKVLRRKANYLFIIRTLLACTRPFYCSRKGLEYFYFPVAFINLILFIYCEFSLSLVAHFTHIVSINLQVCLMCDQAKLFFFHLRFIQTVTVEENLAIDEQRILNAKTVIRKCVQTKASSHQIKERTIRIVQYSLWEYSRLHRLCFNFELFMLVTFEREECDVCAFLMKQNAFMG